MPITASHSAHQLHLSRRELLLRAGLGMGGLGLASLLAPPAMGGEPYQSPLLARQPHFAAKSKRIIHIFPEGGPSQVDTFDPKPMLERFHNQNVDDVLKDYQKNAGEAASGMGRLTGRLQRSAFTFQKHGQSGIEISELLPKLGALADHLCVVRSMRSTTSVHEPAQLLMTTGDMGAVRPSMGSWLVYGLGSENQNLPAFVALSPGGSTSSGDRHWNNAFLPVWARGTGIATSKRTVQEMIEHLRSSSSSLTGQRRQLDLLGEMNRDYAAERGDPLMEGRIAAFETAFRMQVEATDAFDLEREPVDQRERYGDTEQGRQLLLARRLLERGVRVVQVWHNGWDTHDENDAGHKRLCAAADQPLAALITDLKERGMLDDTLVVWAGEFGRTPTSDNNDVATKKSIGRDHNAGGFTIWMAGGGIKAGHVHGATDDFGALAVQDPVEVHDLHATILHLMGFDHERLTYRHSGRDYRLTDVQGRVVKELLA